MLPFWFWWRRFPIALVVSSHSLRWNQLLEQSVILLFSTLLCPTVHSHRLSGKPPKLSYFFDFDYTQKPNRLRIFSVFINGPFGVYCIAQKWIFNFFLIILISALVMERFIFSVYSCHLRFFQKTKCKINKSYPTTWGLLHRSHDAIQHS